MAKWGMGASFFVLLSFALGAESLATQRTAPRLCQHLLHSLALLEKAIGPLDKSEIDLFINHPVDTDIQLQLDRDAAFATLLEIPDSVLQIISDFFNALSDDLTPAVIEGEIPRLTSRFFRNLDDKAQFLIEKAAAIKKSGRPLSPTVLKQEMKNALTESFIEIGLKLLQQDSTSDNEDDEQQEKKQFPPKFGLTATDESRLMRLLDQQSIKGRHYWEGMLAKLATRPKSCYRSVLKNLLALEAGTHPPDCKTLQGWVRDIHEIAPRHHTVRIFYGVVDSKPVLISMTLNPKSSADHRQLAKMENARVTLNAYLRDKTHTP